jgi:XRE family transcriptional regulator, regulator of sulfur utilization
MSPTPRQMGLNLRRERKAKRWSMYRLAKESGRSAETIRKLEDGKADPTVGVLQDLADALGVPLIRLIEGRKRKK